MKNIILILLFNSICLSSLAQSRPTGSPARFNTFWDRIGWIQADSGFILPNRDTGLYVPRFPGNLTSRISGGDSSVYYYNGGRWIKLLKTSDAGNVDTFSISTRAWRQKGDDSLGALLNLKLNISDTSNMLLPYLRKADTTNKWWSKTTRFVDTMYRVNDSTVGYTILGSPYTFEIKGGASSGGSGGTNNANVGSGHRLLIPSTQEIKTLFSDVTGSWDSTSNTNGLTYKVDTSVMSTRAWRQKGDDSVAALLRQVIIDSAAEIRADFPGTSNIEQVLTAGDSTDNNINWRPAAGVTNENQIIYKGIPSNYNTDYSGAGAFRAGLFQAGWVRVNGVNASGRPNVVFNALSYNAPMGGGRILTDEASMRFAAESHFETGGQKLFEIHWPEIYTTSGTAYRGNSMYINKETGAFQLNYLATAGVAYQDIAGKALLSFSNLGNYQFVGRTGSSIITLFNDSTTGAATRYQINLNGTTSVLHSTFGLQSTHDSRHVFNNFTGDVSPTITINDSRNNANMSPIFLNVSSSTAGIDKYGVNAVGSVTGVLSNHIRNTNASSSGVYQISNSGNTANVQLGHLNASGTPTGAIIADASYIRTTSSAGFTLMASNAAGDIRFATGGIVERARLTSAGNLAIGTTTPARLFHVELNDAATNTVSYAKRTTHISSGGTTAAGFGLGEELGLENASNTPVVSIRNSVVFSDPTNASEDADYTIELIAAGSIGEKFRVFSTGSGRFSGTMFLGALNNGSGTDSILTINNTEVRKIPSSLFTTLYTGDGTATNRTVTVSGFLNFTGGNVGIGTSGPDRLLDVLSNANPQVRLTHTDGSIYTDLQTDGNGVLNITPTGRYLSTPTGSTSNRGFVPNVIWNEIDENATSGTGETDLYSYTTPATTLGADGEWLEFTVDGFMNPSATVAGATMTVRAYWAGTEVLEATSVSATANPYTLKVRVIRTSSTNARVIAYVLGGGTALTGAGETNPRVTNVTTTFSNTNIIKTTGQTTDGTQGINTQAGDLKWFPQNLPGT